MSSRQILGAPASRVKRLPHGPLTRFFTKSARSSPAAGMKAPIAASPAARVDASNGIERSNPPIPSTGCLRRCRDYLAQPFFIQVIDRQFRSCRQDSPGNEKVRGLPCSDGRNSVDGAANDEAGARCGGPRREESSALSGERPRLSRQRDIEAVVDQNGCASRRPGASAIRPAQPARRLRGPVREPGCSRSPPSGRSPVEEASTHSVGSTPWPRPGGGDR